jgi:hypothetical protein
MAIILGMVISSTSIGSTDGNIIITMHERFAWFGRAQPALDVLKKLQHSIAFATRLYLSEG